MQSHARVVIIGGGIMGVSLLYHLAKEGWTDAVLVEKGELTSGSTWHAAGQITHGLSNWGLAKMNVYGVEMYSQLEELTGQNATWHGCGSMRVAYHDAEMDSINHTLSVGRGLGVRMEIIDVAEAQKHHPFFNFDGVKAVLHTPDDGHVDPAGATFGLAAGARQMGATIVRQNRCTNVRQLESGEWLVETEKGDITCEHVVNAGGTYARQIGEWMGHDLPMANTTHHYLVTEAVDEFKDLEHELPVVRDDMTYSGYIRMEQKSGLIGIYEKSQPATIWDDGAPWEAEHELFEADYDRIMDHLEHALERMPVLANYGIKREVHGAIPMPPDGNMLLGPTPGLKNAWCCCGSHVGIAWGPGAGKYLAQWMVHGSAEISMRDFDPRRFGAFAYDRDYQIERAKEDYVLRHEIPYPGRQRYTCRPNKTSPIYDRLNDMGAIHEEVYGWERPRWFCTDGATKDDIYGFQRPGWYKYVAEECKAVRERVAVADLSSFSKVELSGPDAESFLERMIPNKAPKKVGSLILTHLLNRHGTIEAEVTIARVEENTFYIMTAAFFEQRVRDHFQFAVNAGEDVTVTVVSEDWGVLAMSGPRSRDVLSQITSEPLDNASWPWLKVRNIEIAGVSGIRALRMSYQGELGWELHVPMDGVAAVYDAIWSAGEAHGIANFGSYALNAMRLEKGFKGASEFTNEVTLPEADAMRFVKMDKGDFLGRDKTQESMEKNSLPWVCVYMEVDSVNADPHASETIFMNGERVGQVSSGGYGFSVEKSLAFGYVDPKASAPGTELEILVLGENRAARVLADPVYDPANELPRS